MLSVTKAPEPLGLRCPHEIHPSTFTSFVLIASLPISSSQWRTGTPWTGLQSMTGRTPEETHSCTEGTYTQPRNIPGWDSIRQPSSSTNWATQTMSSGLTVIWDKNWSVWTQRQEGRSEWIKMRLRAQNCERHGGCDIMMWDWRRKPTPKFFTEMIWMRLHNSQEVHQLKTN